jgi:hypothetical protein
MKKSYDGKGKELEFPEGRGGGKGEPGVPPIYALHISQISSSGSS